MNNAPDQKTETKLVKHTFTTDERNEIGTNLASALNSKRGVEAEFDQVKASYKSKAAESDARIDNLSTLLMSGMEMRQKRCIVVFRPKDGKKDYFLEEKEVTANGNVPVLTEDMTSDDFQVDLIQVESKFEEREELPLFPETGDDRGVIAVGRLKDRWFSALRIKVGKQSIDERLDSEQRSVVNRFDAVKSSAARATTWLKTAIGTEAAKGFEESIKALIESQKERVE